MQMKISGNQKLFAGYIISLVEQMYLRNNEYLSSNCDKKRNLNKGQLIKELSKIMFEFNILNDCLSINKVQQSKLYKELSIKLDEMFNDEYLTERDCIKEILSNCAKDSYYINSFVTSIGISYTLKPVSNSILQKILSDVIDCQKDLRYYLDNGQIFFFYQFSPFRILITSSRKRRFFILKLFVQQSLLFRRSHREQHRFY